MKRKAEKADCRKMTDGKAFRVYVGLTRRAKHTKKRLLSAYRLGAMAFALKSSVSGSSESTGVNTEYRKHGMPVGAGDAFRYSEMAY